MTEIFKLKMVEKKAQVKELNLNDGKKVVQL